MRTHHILQFQPLHWCQVAARKKWLKVNHFSFIFLFSFLLCAGQMLGIYSANWDSAKWCEYWCSESANYGTQVNFVMRNEWCDLWRTAFRVCAVDVCAVRFHSPVSSVADRNRLNDDDRNHFIFKFHSTAAEQRRRQRMRCQWIWVLRFTSSNREKWQTRQFEWQNVLFVDGETVELIPAQHPFCLSTQTPYTRTHAHRQWRRCSYDGWDFNKCLNQRRIQYFSILFKQKMFVFVCTINRCESPVHGTIITIISDNDMQVWMWIWGCWRRRMVRFATPDTRNMPTHTIRPLLKAKTTTCSADERRAFGGRRRCCFRRTHIPAWTQLKKGYRQTLRIHSFFGTHSPNCRTTDFQSMAYDCIGAIRRWSSSCDDNNTHRQTHVCAPIECSDSVDYPPRWTKNIGKMTR